MLTLGASSNCDVCLEQFGSDNKAPCSIQCGHVFCADCINRLTRPVCPLCRTPFDQRTCFKLHVDMDNGRKSPAKASCPTAAEQEARRLQEAIATVANEGSTESNLRQLIADCRAFLQSQPRNLFSDLRVSHRMIAYLCEVKTTLRSQNAAVDSLKDQITQLTTEKSESQRKLETSENVRKEERELAAVVEMNLREHVSRAHTAYETLVDRYQCVVTEWSNLNQELKRLRLKELQYTRPPLDPPNAGMDHRSSPPDVYMEDYLPNPDELRCKGAAVQMSGPYLISPVPELSGRLPSVQLGAFTAVPEVIEVVDNAPQEEDSLPMRQLSQCTEPNHPFSCQCNRLPGFPDMPTSGFAKRSSMSKPSFIVEHASPINRRRESLPTSAVPEMMSGLSRTAPKDMPRLDRPRVQSFNSVSFVSSRPPSRNQSGSRENSPPPSQPVSRPSSPIHDVSTSLPREGSVRINVPQGDSVRRLYNILQKPQPQVSSSPPEPSTSYTSKTQMPHRSHSRSSSRSRSGSITSHRQAPAAPNATASPPTTSDVHSTIIPQQPISHAVSRASDAAMAIEKTQKERQMAEKAMKVKEKEHEQRERRKSDRERERSDADRARAESDRFARKTASSTTAVTPSHHPQHATSHHSPSIPTTSHREPANGYIPPPSAPLSSSASPGIMPKVPKSISGTTTSSDSQARKSSTANHHRSSTSHREASASHQSQSHRYGSGSSKIMSSTTSSTTPPIAAV
ncbi:hypothetical protein AX17_006002 [Amanita inopinata Kibby_2008]|nr:hypothetical protein AX17_006002 [Amanita inopinata Kibby_2008]